MTPGLNKVMLIGQLGKSPEIRYTSNSRPVTHFSLGVSQQWTTSDGDLHEDTAWFNVVVWDALAQKSYETLRANQTVYIEGRLQTRGWQDEQGNQHYQPEIVAHAVLALDATPNGTKP